MQNAAARVIAKIGRRDHISPILFKLHLLPVEFRIKYIKILLLTCSTWPCPKLHHRATSVLYITQNTLEQRSAFGIPKV